MTAVCAAQPSAGVNKMVHLASKGTSSPGCVNKGCEGTDYRLLVALGWPPQQIADVELQRVSQSLHVVHSDVALSSLDRPHIRSVKASKIGKHFLTDAFGQSLCFEKSGKAQPCGFGGTAGV